jgi:hypothetical protein
MTKDQLLGKYRTKLNHIRLAYASVVMWSYPDIPRVFVELHQETLRNDQRGISGIFPDIEDFVCNDVSLRVATEELYASAYRSAIKELLPITKSYCHNTNQLAKLKSQAWFPFWSVLRNCWSHDMRFNFNPHEKSLLPVEWSGVNIDVCMNGQVLTYADCTYEKIRDLIEVACDFVQDKIA